MAEANPKNGRAHWREVVFKLYGFLIHRRSRERKQPSMGDRQLVPYQPTENLTQLTRVRMNLVPLRAIRFYIPDDDESVPIVFDLGKRTISTAAGKEDCLLSGYLSALCAVLPDLADIAKKVMENLGFQVEEISVPSEAARLNIVISPQYRHEDIQFEILNFAQFFFLPVQNRFGLLDAFWREVGINTGMRVTISMPWTCNEEVMRIISSALSASGLRTELRSSIASLHRALSATSTPLGNVLSEAAKVNLKRHYRGLYSL